MLSAAHMTRQVTGALVQAAPAQKGPYPLMTPRQLPSGCALDYVNAAGANHIGSSMDGYVQIKAKGKSRGQPVNVARVQATFDV